MLQSPPCAEESPLLVPKHALCLFFCIHSFFAPKNLKNKFGTWDEILRTKTDEKKSEKGRAL